MSTLSFESSSVLGAETLESDGRKDQAGAPAWVEPTLTALFTTTAVLVVSFIAVVMGLL
jgi:hypothetical protein